MLSDNAIVELVKRHAAEGKFACMKHDVPVGFGVVYIKPDDSTEVVARYGVPVPLQDTDSGRDVLALSRSDRARFIMAAFDLVVAELQTSLLGQHHKYDVQVLKRAIKRLLTARAEWGQGQLARLVDRTVANYSIFITDITLCLFRHIRRFDLLAGGDGAQVRAAARALRPDVKTEIFASEKPVRMLQAILDELMGQADVIDIGRYRESR